MTRWTYNIIHLTQWVRWVRRAGCPLSVGRLVKCGAWFLTRDRALFFLQRPDGLRFWAADNYAAMDFRREGCKIVKVLRPELVKLPEGRVAPDV